MRSPAQGKRFYGAVEKEEVTEREIVVAGKLVVRREGKDGHEGKANEPGAQERVPLLPERNESSPPQPAGGPRHLDHFVIDRDGVEIAMAQRAGQPHNLLVVATLGMAQGVDELQALRAALDANMLMLGENAPVFSRSPDTGDMLLQYCLPIGTCTATLLDEMVARLVQVVQNWQSGALAGRRSDVEFGDGIFGSQEVIREVELREAQLTHRRCQDKDLIPS